MLRQATILMELLIFLLAACTGRSNAIAFIEPPVRIKGLTNTKNLSAASAETICSRRQVPVLCYHHITSSLNLKNARFGYEVSISEFHDQMKTLFDSGYHTILPDQLYEYLV